MNEKLSHIQCWYCHSEGGLQFMPSNRDRTQFYEHDAYCVFCGRHYVGVVKRYSTDKDAA